MVSIKIDVDMSKDISKMYGVSETPCFLVISNQREVGRLEGTNYMQLEAMYEKYSGNPRLSPRRQDLDG